MIAKFSDSTINLKNNPKHMFAPDNERKIAMKNEYINEIINLLPYADADLLDFIFQLLKKSVELPINPSETHLQSA